MSASSRSVVAALLSSAASLSPLAAQKPGEHVLWPWGVGAEAGSLERRDLFNLGALGAKAWDADRPEPALERESGQRRFESSQQKDGDQGPKRLVVRAIFGGGPAQKAGVSIDDVIVGVDGQRFDSGCFEPLARALQRAESADGKLTLQVERGEKKLELAVKLKKLGPHASAPESGKMRQQLLDQALEWLAQHQVGGGYAETLGGKNGAVVQTCLAGLAWIGGGSSLQKGRYKAQLAEAQSFVLRGLETPNEMPFGQGANWDQSTWGYAHAAIFLGELALASGRKASPDLQKIADTLCTRQEQSGGYGHGIGGKNALGYIELNIMASFVASGLSLLHQTGCKVDRAVLDKLFAYAQQSAGEDGGVGYSTASGQQGQGNIGRTAGFWLAAVGLGRADHPYTEKMRDYVRKHIADTMGGHASLQQHILLAGLAASALGKEAATEYWAGGLQRDLTLARAPDGSFQPRPWHESLLMQSNTDVSVGEVWSTASWAIVLSTYAEQGKGGFPGWCGRKK